MLFDEISGPARKHKLVDGLLGDRRVSIRRACKALQFDTSTYHHKSRHTGQAGLEQRIKEICHGCPVRLPARPRFTASQRMEDQHEEGP